MTLNVRMHFVPTFLSMLTLMHNGHTSTLFIFVTLLMYHNIVAWCIKGTGVAPCNNVASTIKDGLGADCSSPKYAKM